MQHVSKSVFSSYDVVNRLGFASFDKLALNDAKNHFPQIIV